MNTSKVINSDNGASDFIWVISMTAELKVPGILGTGSADFTCSEFEQRREIMQRKCVSSSSSFP